MSVYLQNFEILGTTHDSMQHAMRKNEEGQRVITYIGKPIKIGYQYSLKCQSKLYDTL